MALIKSVRGFTPEFGENCFLADNATINDDENGTRTLKSGFR